MHDTTSIRLRLDQEFDLLAGALKRAAAEENHWVVAKIAEQFGMAETEPIRKPGTAWAKTEHGLTLWFQWRFYDQSGPFSPQKDMNILSLELRNCEEVLRKAEERYED